MMALFQLDNLHRHPEDGAYHCPTCEAPFTRRSNLRRHFVIHTRTMPFKCPLCEQRFSRSDELHYHSLTCTNSTWGETVTLSNLIHADSPPQSSPTSSCPSSDGSDEDMVYADFMSCLSSAADSPHKEKYTFHSLDEMLGVSMELPATPTCQKRGSPPYINPVARQRTKKIKEKPVYTRRQVEDMFNIVSNCFAGTMEEVLKRCHATDAEFPNIGGARNCMETTFNTTTSAALELEKNLDMSLSHAFSGLQNFSAEMNAQRHQSSRSSLGRL